MKEKIKLLLAILAMVFLFQNYLENTIDQYIPKGIQLLISLGLLGYVLFETNGKFKFESLLK